VSSKKNKDSIFQLIKKIVLTKSFLGSIVFALALWIYVSMNSGYTTKVNIPLKVLIANNAAIEKQVPSSITVVVKGTGWNIISLIFFNPTAICQVDLTHLNIDSSYSINKSDMFKGLMNLTNLQAAEVYPEKIDISLTKVNEISVPIIPFVTIIPREGFIIVGKLKTEPDQVTVRGFEKVLKNINLWYTQSANVKDAFSDVRLRLNLQDTMRNMVKLSINEVRVSAQIEQSASITVNDVEVKLKGGSLMQNYILQPDYIKVTVEGGIDDISELTPDMIKASVDALDVARDSTGLVQPVISVPENIKIISMQPRFLYLI
jgi:hypothetical protein